MKLLSLNHPHTWKVICFPNGEKIVLADTYENGLPLSLYDINHNVFRLNAQGKVVWQVQRDDSNHPPDWWETLHRIARANGMDGAREPFMYLWVEHANGYVDRDPASRMPKDTQTWVPNSKIYLTGSAYQEYVLDPDTGIAKNITDWPVRPW